MRDSPRDIVNTLAELVANQAKVKIKVKAYAPNTEQESREKQAETSSLKTEYGVKLHA